MKYDVITYAPHEGLNYTILNKIKLLWKRVGEPREIQRVLHGRPKSTALLGLIQFIRIEKSRSNIA